MNRIVILILTIIVNIIANKSYSQYNWEKSDGIDTINVCTFFKCSSGKLFAGTYNYGIYSSCDNGKTWQDSNSGINEVIKHVYSITENNDTIYITVGDCTGGNIYYSLDFGNSWTPTSYVRGATDIIAIDSVICLSTGCSVYEYARSTDYGKTWNHEYYNWDAYKYNYKRQDKVLYANELFSGLLVSYNSGKDWKAIGIKNVFSSDYILLEEDILLATEQGLFISKYDKYVWQTITDQGLNDDFYRIYFLDVSGDTIYAASDTAIYFTVYKNDNLAGWKKLTHCPGLDGNYQINELKVYNHIVRLGIRNTEMFSQLGNGVWNYGKNFSTMIGKAESGINIKIYPNPANDIIFIGTPFEEYNVRIYSETGILISHGKNLTKYNVSDLPFGIYYIEILTKKHSITKKIIVTN